MLTKGIQRERLVLTFDTPTAAFAFETHCKRYGLPGRLMPVPVSLTGGCGIGWTAELKDEACLRATIEKYGLAFKLFTTVKF